MAKDLSELIKKDIRQLIELKKIMVRASLDEPIVAAKELNDIKKLYAELKEELPNDLDLLLKRENKLKKEELDKIKKEIEEKEKKLEAKKKEEIKKKEYKLSKAAAIFGKKEGM